jgi:hypothetical protein
MLITHSSRSECQHVSYPYYERQATLCVPAYELRDPILRFWLNIITFYARKSHLHGLYKLNDVNLCYKRFVIAFQENHRVLH